MHLDPELFAAIHGMELPADFDRKKTSGFEDDPECAEYNPCASYSHNPPTGLVVPRGKRYRHVCPGCSTLCPYWKKTNKQETLTWKIKNFLQYQTPMLSGVPTATRR